jgi:hypothetical protein
MLAPFVGRTHLIFGSVLRGISLHARALALWRLHRQPPNSTHTSRNPGGAAHPQDRPSLLASMSSRVSYGVRKIGSCGEAVFVKNEAAEAVAPLDTG